MVYVCACMKKHTCTFFLKTKKKKVQLNVTCTLSATPQVEQAAPPPVPNPYVSRSRLTFKTKRATSSMLANSLSRKISIITRSQYGEGHRAASQHTLALGAWDGSGTRRLGLAFPALIVGRFMHTCHGAARSISSALE